MSTSLSFLTTNTPANGNIASEVQPGDLEQVQANIETYFGAILDELRIDRADPNAKDTPRRYAKMLVQEVCRGRFQPPPAITTFPNTRKLDELLWTGPIAVRSLCSHHFCPIIGKCWIGVVPNEILAGLSKFDRVVDWLASRPQIQEELTVQIADFVETTLSPKGVAVVVEASHTCMTWRGVKAHPDAVMGTNVMRGVFREKPEARAEFLQSIGKR